MTNRYHAFNRPERQFLSPGQLDDVGRAVLTLTQQVCTLADRVAVLEAVLSQSGVDIAEAVDTYQPDAEVQARIDARCETIVSAVVSALQGE